MFSRKYTFYWNGRNKRRVALACIGIATVGGVIGFSVGRATAQKIEVAPPIEPIVIEEPIVEVITAEEPVVEIIEITPNYYNIPLDHSIQDYIRELCESNNLPMELVIALIECESSFRPNVVSKTGDYGLMQINRINHKWLTEKYGITDFLDPQQNILCGVSILAEHYSRYEDTHKALMAYNMGATGARKHWNEGKNTSAYSIRVVEAMEKYTEVTANV